jgi:hypothetical protein
MTAWRKYLERDGGPLQLVGLGGPEIAGLGHGHRLAAGDVDPVPDLALHSDGEVVGLLLEPDVRITRAPPLVLSR